MLRKVVLDGSRNSIVFCPTSGFFVAPEPARRHRCGKCAARRRYGLAVSVNVSDNLSRAAVNETIRNTEAVIRASSIPMLAGDLTSQTPAQQAQIND